MTTTASADTREQIQHSVDKRVQQFIMLRDAIKKMEEKHTEELKPLLELKDQVAGWLQTFMETAGANSVKTEFGTCHFNTRVSATLADPDAFMRFVRETENFDLLDRRANSTAVKEYVEANKALPPGVNLSSIKTVGVRRPTST